MVALKATWNWTAKSASMMPIVTLSMWRGGRGIARCSRKVAKTSTSSAMFFSALHQSRRRASRLAASARRGFRGLLPAGSFGHDRGCGDLGWQCAALLRHSLCWRRAHPVRLTAQGRELRGLSKRSRPATGCMRPVRAPMPGGLWTQPRQVPGRGARNEQMDRCAKRHGAAGRRAPPRACRSDRRPFRPARPACLPLSRLARCRLQGGSRHHAAAFFAGFGARVNFVNSTIPSLHAIPTLATARLCGVSGNHGGRAARQKRGFDGAGAALAHIHGAPAGARSRLTRAAWPSSTSGSLTARKWASTRAVDLSVPKGCMRRRRAGGGR